MPDAVTSTPHSTASRAQGFADCAAASLTVVYASRRGVVSSDKRPVQAPRRGGAGTRIELSRIAGGSGVEVGAQSRAVHAWTCRAGRNSRRARLRGAFGVWKCERVDVSARPPCGGGRPRPQDTRRGGTLPRRSGRPSTAVAFPPRRCSFVERCCELPGPARSDRGGAPQGCPPPEPGGGAETSTLRVRATEESLFFVQGHRHPHRERPGPRLRSDRRRRAAADHAGSPRQPIAWK